MFRYQIRRFVLMIPTLLIIAFLVFLLLFLSPGEPVMMLVPIDELGQMSDEQLDRIRSELGLDRPILVRYADWLVHVFQGDPGRSIHKRRPVSALLAARFPVTLELALLSVLTVTIVAVSIGLYTAVRPGGIGDFTGNIVALMGVAAPNFWVALLLIILFGAQLR